MKNDSTYRKISICASIFTIISIFIAIWIFNTQNCIEEKIQNEEYKNVLAALEREAEVNLATTNHILSGENGSYTNLSNLNLPIDQYYTQTLGNLLSTGTMKNRSIIYTMFDVAHRMQRINMILDKSYDLYFIYANYNPVVPTTIVENMKNVFIDAKDLKNMLPELRKLIWEELDNVKPKTLFCS